eukprot:1794743-Amphidinium_carterae.1
MAQGFKLHIQIFNATLSCCLLVTESCSRSKQQPSRTAMFGLQPVGCIVAAILAAMPPKREEPVQIAAGEEGGDDFEDIVDSPYGE